MKRILIVYVKIVSIIILLFIGLYFAFKSMTKNNLDEKLNYLNKNWIELLTVQDKNDKFLSILANKCPQDIMYVDSLNLTLLESTKTKKEIKECNPNLVYDKYLTNKYMLPLMKYYSDNQIGDIEKQKALKSLENNIDDINKIIEKYNSSVSDYNKYYSMFPNFILAKSYGFKRKDYFEIRYGIENKDPKIAQKETREWQKKIEMEQGLSE
ncbi:LemA family protein [Flavobacterium sp. SUN046]|uniref:LemA family protein n=1 Tax=Flavobacterium sp. SUN046 TaxID=3002440 RepID=UPI002DB7981B|nr:LemA family protein [Flavobacterium sp. SUN046]MEC4049001.1 LemA family protein [Flavobacterium sp. SUN046]